MFSSRWLVVLWLMGHVGKLLEILVTRAKTTDLKRERKLLAMKSNSHCGYNCALRFSKDKIILPKYCLMKACRVDVTQRVVLSI